MDTLYFDIETLPASEDRYSVLQAIFDKKKENPSFTKTFEEFVSGTSFTGGFGRIACIGWAINNEKATCLEGTEAEQLTRFWEMVNQSQLVVGHNILDFDLPFLKQRSIVLGIKPAAISLKRYSSSPVYDTMHEWNCWSRSEGWSSLDTLAKMFGLPSSKDGIDGSQVAEFYKAGKIKEIKEYCIKDVELTRLVYKKMTFADTKQTLPF